MPSAKCPPGVFCMTPTFLVICGAVLLGAYYLFKHKHHEQRPIIYREPNREQPMAVQIATTQGGDDRYSRAPKPERHWITTPDIPTESELYGKLPRVPTRGIPETYQSMGVLKLEDGQILPLYGRRTASRSDRFQYYTRTDSYNPVQLPIRYNRRDCQDDIGCEELSDKDVITITPTNQKATATIYRFDGPTYVPGIL